MAERRMFARKIIDTDLFLDMPISARLLYYDLCMRADDDGFVGSPKKITRLVGCAEDDLKLLVVKQYIIPFDNGVCVIKDWRIHNYIRSDRYHETQYTDEKRQLAIGENGTYQIADTAGMTLGIPHDNQLSYQRSTQSSLGKVSQGDISRAREKSGPKRSRRNSAKPRSASYDLAEIEVMLERGNTDE